MNKQQGLCQLSKFQHNTNNFSSLLQTYLNYYFIYLLVIYFTLNSSCFKTDKTVLKRIFKSSPMLHSAMYLVSNFTTSSKSVISLRPLICHNPVIPGLIANLARWCKSYADHSSYVGGLVPINDMSPFSTLKNCGNSSKEVLLIKSPIPVFLSPFGNILLPITLVSNSTLKHHTIFDTIFFIKSFFRSSASMYILSELVHFKLLPFLPTRI